jgi:hypothetical protein
VWPQGYHCDPTKPLIMAGLASQKNCLTVYLMSVYGDAGERAWFQKAWAKTGKKLDMGGACVRFKTAEHAALDVIGEAIRRTPAKAFVERYVQALASTGRGPDGKKRAAGTRKATARPAGNEGRRKGHEAGIEEDIRAYNERLAGEWGAIADKIAKQLSRHLPDAACRVWHGHPVWFIEGNPVAGYSKLKGCVRLLFWSGQSFDEDGLSPEGSFKAAERRYESPRQVSPTDLARWCGKARTIQWDYKNIVKRRGRLVRLR